MVENRRLAVLVIFCLLTTSSALAIALDCGIYFDSERTTLTIVSATKDGEPLDLEPYQQGEWELQSSRSYECYPRLGDPELPRIIVSRSGSYQGSHFENVRCGQ